MNPFKNNTVDYYLWEILKDLKWHCCECELRYGNDEIWDKWEQKGIQFEIDENGSIYSTLYCPNCNNITKHIKLRNLNVLNERKTHDLSAYLINKIKYTLDYMEAFFYKKMPAEELEVNFKFPKIRWKNKNRVITNLEADEIKENFYLLTKKNTLLRHEHCHRCFETGKRGNFLGIKFWYEGDGVWRGKDKYDENGCVGCFWYDPIKWREELNKTILRSKIFCELENMNERDL